MVKVVHHKPNQTSAILILPGFGSCIHIPIVYTCKEGRNASVNCSLVRSAARTCDFVILKRGMVFLSETEVDGFGSGCPTFDHGVLVETWAGFEQTERC